MQGHGMFQKRPLPSGHGFALDLKAPRTAAQDVGHLQHVMLYTRAPKVKWHLSSFPQRHGKWDGKDDRYHAYRLRSIPQTRFASRFVICCFLNASLCCTSRDQHWRSRRRNDDGDGDGG